MIANAKRSKPLARDLPRKNSADARSEDAQGMSWLIDPRLPNEGILEPRTNNASSPMPGRHVDGSACPEGNPLDAYPVS